MNIHVIMYFIINVLCICIYYIYVELLEYKLLMKKYELSLNEITFF